MRHVNENNEIEKNTKRDAEGQKSNTGATPNRKSNNVEVTEKKEREKERAEQGSVIPKCLCCKVVGMNKIIFAAGLAMAITTAASVFLGPYNPKELGFGLWHC